MPSERTRPPFATAEGWINPLLERGRRIETIDENVGQIRAWVVTGLELNDQYGNTSYRRRMRKRFGNERFTYVMNATSEEDPESVDILKNALAIGVIVAEVPANGRKSLDITFRYDYPDPENTSDLEPSPELYCHIFAHETKAGTVLETEWRKIPELMPHELDMVYELTNTVAGFIPPPTP